MRWLLWVLVASFGCGSSVPADPGSDGATSTTGSTGGSTGSDSTATSGDSSESGTATSSSTSAPEICEVEVPCEGCESWRDEFDGRAGDFDGFNGLSVAPNGDLVAFGHQDRGILIASSGAARIVRYSASGELLWARLLEPDEGSLSAVSGVFEDEDTLVVALDLNASSSPGQESQTSIVRLTGEGEPLGEPEVVNTARPEALIRAGDSILLHSYNSLDSSNTIRLQRLEGTTLESIFPPEAFDDLDARDHTMVAGPDDTVLVAARTREDTPYLARLAQGEDGAWTTQWTLQEFDTIDGEGSVVAAAGLADGSTVYISQTSESSTIGLLDPTQQPVWKNALDLRSCCTGPQLTTDPAGRVFVVGEAPATERPPRMFAFSGCDGTELWRGDLGEAAGFGSGIAVVDDRLFAAGNIVLGPGDSSAWIAALDL